MTEFSSAECFSQASAMQHFSPVSSQSTFRTQLHPDAVDIHMGERSWKAVFAKEAESLSLSLSSFMSGLLDDQAAFAAACEALFAAHPQRDVIRIAAPQAAPALQIFHEAGLIAIDGEGPFVSSACLHQTAQLWTTRGALPAFPLSYAMTNQRRHPLRRPGRDGVLYRRFIPWLGQELTIETADPGKHLDLFHAWMNDERIDAFWEEAGDLSAHRDFLETRRANPVTEPLIGAFDGVPFAYFELYWAREDRLGAYYDAGDFDRGWHVAVGNDAFRGRQFIAAWLPSLMHFMFLDEPRTMRIVGEPDAGHRQQIRNLMRSGFAGLKHVQFPHKRSLLVMLLRERFFEDRLYCPDFLRAA